MNAPLIPHKSIEALINLYLVVIGIGLAESVQIFFVESNSSKITSGLKSFLIHKVLPFLGYVSLVFQFTLGTFTTLNENLLYKEAFFFLSGLTIAFMGLSLKYSKHNYYYVLLFFLFLWDFGALIPECQQNILTTLFFGVFQAGDSIASTYSFWCSSDFYTLVSFGTFWLFSRHFKNLREWNSLFLAIVLLLFCLLNFRENANILLD